MNQILQVENPKKIKKAKIFQSHLLLFLFSSITILLFSILGYLLYDQNKKYNMSKKLSEQYDIIRLYSNINNYDINNLEDSNNFSNYNNLENYTTSSINNNFLIGTIEIPKLNLYYPFFSSLNDECLQIYPCRFFGDMPPKNSNLCIAGHNYENDLFFSKISTLNLDDEIIITNNSNQSFSYYVSDIYEVQENDFSPITIYNHEDKQLTLITCNNFNKNRIIVRCDSNKS